MQFGMATACNSEFSEWSRRWMCLAKFSGKRLVDEESRIASVIALWKESIPPGWERERGRDSRLLDPRRRYCRGNYRQNSVRRGEHVIEYEILNPSPRRVPTTCLGAKLVDGINAVPLAKDACGGRRGNVEADMLLLVRDEHAYRLQLIEVKVTSDNAWFAAVENLRQLKLFLASPEARRLFHERCPTLGLGQELEDVMGVVLAPRAHEFYEAPVKRRDSVAPARRLLKRLRDETGVDTRLATWDPHERVIEEYMS